MKLRRVPTNIWVALAATLLLTVANVQVGALDPLIDPECHKRCGCGETVGDCIEREGCGSDICIVCNCSGHKECGWPLENFNDECGAVPLCELNACQT
jgi:hypothetical protein